MMGYQAPRIDRIAKKGVEFTDYYGHTRIPERTCWNFRAGAKEGWQKTDVTMAGESCPFRL